MPLDVQRPSDRETTLLGMKRRWAISLSVGPGLVLGALTALGQQYLSDDWRPAANCAGTWTLAAFAAAGASRERAVAAFIGALTLVALLSGYAIASEARDFAVSSRLILFWGAAAVTVGPVVGLAAASVRRADDRLAVIGAGVVSGILIGEGVHGLTVISDTTAPHWWVVQQVLGVVLIAGVMAYRQPSRSNWLAGLSATAAAAAALWLVINANPIGLF